MVVCVYFDLFDVLCCGQCWFVVEEECCCGGIGCYCFGCQCLGGCLGVDWFICVCIQYVMQVVFLCVMVGCRSIQCLILYFDDVDCFLWVVGMFEGDVYFCFVYVDVIVGVYYEVVGDVGQYFCDEVDEVFFFECFDVEECWYGCCDFVVCLGDLFFLGIWGCYGCF